MAEAWGRLVRKPLTILIALLVGLSLGLVAGRVTAPRRSLAEELVACEIGNAGSTLQALHALQSGSLQQGLGLLEASLSLHAVVLDEWLRELRSEDTEQLIDALSGIAAYRAQYPYASGVAAADARVTAILSQHVRTQPR